ncbi:hypothetical protein [Micromonospora sp. NBC_01638]|uniref:hypothetical protein n=1 Tax=Micromonospora sp. NBC_01638 TaxID=2975982 RepID=UPI003864248F|nr:hypothetical protein OG811_27550 [Micromonospora sp. NBC_01638]
MILALLLGLAAGWLLPGRRGIPGKSIVDGDPIAGLAVIEPPASAATTDEARPAAAVDPAPTAVADEPVPVDTVSAPAVMTEPDGPTPAAISTEALSTVDPADMALTEAPPPAPVAEQSDAAELRPEPDVESAPEPVTLDEQPAPAAVIAPRQPAEASPTDDAPPAASLVDDAETKAVVADPVPAAAPVTPTGPADDFRRIQGIGPKMAAALQDAGVRTYGQLGELDEPALRDLIRAAGLRAASGLASWPQQARVLAGAGDAMAAVLPGGNQA